MADSRTGAMGYAPLFLKHGYAVLSPDSRAHGASGGAIATYGALERRDVHSWIDWLYTNHPPQRLYGLGESMGGSILLQSLAVEPRFRAVAVESAFSSLREIGYDRIAQHFHINLFFKRLLFWPAMDAASIYAQAHYGVDLDSVSALPAVAASATPVLLIHGQQDDNVVADHSDEIEAANPSQVALWRPERAGHAAALGTCPELFEQKIIAWFEQHR
jgi:predicted alpha/beta-fold hydrolase